MVQTVQAIYENGVLRPLEKLSLGEHQQVQLLIETNACCHAERSGPLR
jgi:predicted DNA-binding antitoxin AbrB/MazE fold protein